MSRDSEQPWILCIDVVVACPAGCDEPTLEVERRQLMFLLEGLEMRPAEAPAPVAAHTVL